MGTYNSDPLVYTLADAVAQSSDLKGRIYNKMLEVGAQQNDDFTRLEGSPGAQLPFWKKQDLKAQGGDRVTFSVIGEAAGPGARGEQELTGRTSEPRMGVYTCQVDFFRDAVELTKKQKQFLTTGQSLESTCAKMLSKKMGIKRQNDMMHALLRTTNALYLRPGYKTSRDTIRATDVLTPNFIVEAKARLQGLGARPISQGKMKSGAPIHRYLDFIPQNAMTDIRNSTSYQNAMLQAAERSSDGNPLFSGALPDWQGMLFWEHIVVNPDSNDALGSPLAPYAVLGEAITNADTRIDIKGGDGTSTLVQYFRDFPGYDYLFTEDQSPVSDSNVYYFWVVNASGADAGKTNFYSYTGSSNTGNKIACSTASDSNFKRLYSSTTGTYRFDTVGSVTYAGAVAAATAMGLAGITFAHPVGSHIIPANAYGVPIARSFIFGAGAAMRAYGAIESQVIKERRDYGFVEGMGYEGIWGQRACLDTQGVPRNYVVLESAYEIPGIQVPYMQS